jgi:hypothetical protein
MIITVIVCATMICWQSLHLGVNRDTGGPASAEGDDDQNELLLGKTL